MATVLQQILNQKRTVRVKLLSNFCSSEDLCNLWNKMSHGDRMWRGKKLNIIVVSSDDPDYYVVINSTNESVDKNRTVVFRMEPYMNLRPALWGEWSKPASSDFLKVLSHEGGDYNNNEWHLSWNVDDFITRRIDKPSENSSVLSAVLSGAYTEMGHIRRTDFIRYLEKYLSRETPPFKLHLYGRENRWEFKSYCGPLPSHCKDAGIFPYKYVFNAENNSIPNYYTEKLIDGILGESLTFYWGCPNVKDYIDPRAYVVLSLSNFKADADLIAKAIQEDWHSKRLPFIIEAKKKILYTQQFFPRLECILYEAGTDIASQPE